MNCQNKHVLTFVSLVVLVSAAGMYMTLISQAANPAYSVEPESGSSTENIVHVSDTTASLGHAIKFGQADTVNYACTKFLSPGGNVQSFLDSLTVNQVGCLREGVYSTGALTFRSSGATLASYPGERATIDLGSSMSTISEGTVGMNIKRINLVTTNVHTIRIYGNNSVIEHSLITNRHANTAGACVGIGGSTARPSGVVLRGNKFADCGGNATNLNHGIYAHSFTNLLIEDNIFYSNGGYSIQLYPNADRAIVRHNVIDGSNEYSIRGGLIIDGVSDNHLIEHNIFYRTAATALQARVGTGHQANYNCFYSNTGGDVSGSIQQKGNINADPLYIDRGARDYRLKTGSGCLASVQYDTAAKIAASW